MTSKKSASDLQDNLVLARDASPATRIEFRDGIAIHGDAAVEAVAPWLQSSDLAAFAVRVIRKAGELGARGAAVTALTDARSQVSGVVRRDIDEALGLLGAKAAPEGKPVVARAPIGVADALYSALVSAARAHRTLTYSEAGESLGLSMRNPHHRRLLGQNLGAISEYEVERNRPMLSAIVVHKGEGDLGSGFFQLGEEVGLKRAVEDNASFAVREMHRVFEHWSRPPAKLVDTPTGAPDFRTRFPAEDPPEAIGPCGFSGASGLCLNPGRWDRDGVLCCTTHALARDPRPFSD